MKFNTFTSLIATFIFIYFFICQAEAQSCSSGQFWNGCDNECDSCPAGMWCSGGLNPPTPCDSGKSSNTGATSSGDCISCASGYYAPQKGLSACIACPAGFSCTSTGIPEPCNSGYYSLSGVSSCTICPAGSYCPSKDKSPIQCPPGSYSNNGATTCTRCTSPTQYASSAGSTGCTSCPSGKTCLDPALSPQDCPSGTYIDNVNSPNLCITCPSGKECATVTGTPTNCGPGTYSPGGAITSCIPCPSGYYSTGSSNSECLPCPSGYDCSTSTSATICTPGKYSPALSSSCEDCPAGTYQDASGQSGCKTCPPGYRCPSGSNSPISCGTGYYSDPYNSSQCLQCSAGTWSDPADDFTTCAQCTAGYECPGDGTRIACTSGTYSLAGAESCEQCPAGYSCASTTSQPVLCSSGYSLQGEISCQTCPEGYRCLDPSKSPEACESGEYSPTGSDLCFICPAGQECSGSSKTSCSSGYYSLGNTLGCTQCPAGKMCPISTESPIDCRLGYYSSAGATECTPCPQGFYCPSTTSSPIACNAGEFSLPASTFCTPCLPGFYCPSTTTLSQIPCEQGKFSTGGASVCTDCPAGKACPSPKGGQVDCPPGYYSLGNQVTCLLCPAGYSCADPTVSPVACTPGTYSSIGSDSCTNCPAGYFCPKTDVLPQLCPTGTYSTGSATSCSDCDPGYVCGMGSNTSTPSDGICPQGYFCPQGIVSAQPCEAGTYGIKINGISQIDACADCLPGNYCPPATSQLLEINFCPRGHYCPSRTEYSTQHPCPAGKYYDLFGATSETDCIICPEGYFCPEGSITYKDKPCFPGYYCPPETGRSNQYACPAGTFNNVKGRKTISDCSTCPAGYACNGNTDTQVPTSNTGLLGLSNPTPCQRGYYKDTDGTGTCTQCPAGYPCPFSRTSDPYLYICQPGYYCPQGSVSVTQNQCPPGTFSNRYGNRAATDCEICPRGFYCPAASGGPYPPLPCSEGHYCPGAPLSNGSFTSQYYGSSIYVGTTRENEYPCPAGTYSSRTNLYSPDQCNNCPKGYWCAGGLNKWNGECSPGHYCPEGSWSPTTYPCPAGTYSNEIGLTSEDECLPCPEGSYCGEGFTVPVLCPVGTYSNVTNTIGMGPSNNEGERNCMECPAGYYCQLGSKNPIECGTSKYSISGQGCCDVCLTGYYCPLNETSEEAMLQYRCPAGMYCPAGQGSIPTQYSNACPKGHFCIEATLLPEPCPNGTYNPNTGLKSSNECLLCPPGYYCEGGKSFIDGKCLPGYYCPQNSSISTQIPCPKRTYRDRYGAEDDQQCNICPNGFYCEEATVNPIVCPPGYYCIIGSYEPESCPIGTYSNTSGLKEPEDCTPCPAGLYCDGIGATQPSGLCDPGFYCTGGAFTSAPPDPPTGGLCPKGGYCTFGSSYPTTCEKGTYNNFTGGRTQDDCYSCPAGYYCAGSNLPLPSGLCSAGWYCTGGASLPTQHDAQPGYYTNDGATEQLECPPGTYGIAPKQASCADCPEGNYCPISAGTTYQTCTAGNYCPTKSANPTPCPEGTYTSKTGLKEEEQCLLCDPGSYCQGTGKTSVTGPCNAGTYCPAGRSSPIGNTCPIGHYCPPGTVDPIPCPQGKYSGTTSNTDDSFCNSCTAGYYCASPGLGAVSGSCTAGYYCNAGSDTPTPTDGVMGDICPQGSYCPTGSSSPIPCSAGTYSDIQGRGTCFNCPKGYYCPTNTIDPIICTSGSYCPEGTGTAIPSCPPGSYAPYTGLEEDSQCLLCSPGKYCSIQGLSAPDGDCAAGTICYAGAINSNGDLGILGGSSESCPAGHYCTEGVVAPIPCPIGTFRSGTGGSILGDCLPCSPGKYCPVVGLTTAVLDCSEGYYCVSGAVIFKPSDGITGDLCPKGKYCIEGTSTPQSCPEGTFSNVIGSSECYECPEGYYCPIETVEPIICPAGRFCPNGTITIPPSCPEGSYSTQTGLKDKSECTLCQGGKYCSIPGLTAPDGVCKPGYYCTSGALNETGGLGELGGVTGLCPNGHYCLPGTVYPLQCPPGTFSPDFGNNSPQNCQNCSPGKYCPFPGQINAVEDCSEGFYCSSGAYVPNPNDGVTGNICTKSNYCPKGSYQPIPCLETTYNDIEGQSTCKICPTGYYCVDATETPDPCPKGKYCPEGTGSIPFDCPKGSYRNLTSGTSINDCFLCPGGHYCSEDGLILPDGDCSEGYYCYSGAMLSNGTSGILGGEGSICPPGTYCISKSFLPESCPNGTYRSEAGGQSLNDCLQCTAGSYCFGIGLVYPTGNCSAGYYCPIGQTVSSPPEFVCPEGFYCPEGYSSPQSCPGGTYQPGKGESSCYICPEGFFCTQNTSVPSICPLKYYCPIQTEEPIICPNGTYGIMEGIKEISECAACPPGKYCQLGEIVGNCSAGYICHSGSPTNTPTNIPQSFCDFCICPKGYYCPEGTMWPIPCPSGTFGTEEGGTNSSSCGECQPGDWCLDSSIEPIPCPIGSYCPNNATVKIPVPCPITTYNDKESGASLSDCQPCKAGYYCPEEGLATYLQFPCPTAHYCAENSSTPIACPEGTYRDIQNANNVSDCYTCTPGYYCPEQTDHPLECKISQYCPEGTGGTPQLCPGGQFCPKRNYQPEECPEGFYCEEGASSPTYCPIGYYCPTNSSNPTLCPSGYRRFEKTGLRVNVDDSCMICEAGTYGNDTNREYCRPCGAGYVCLTGATQPNPTSISEHHGYICPKGFTCPTGSSKETPCAPGTYNPNTGYGESSCIKCADGTFTHVSGSLFCSTCGPSAVSNSDRTSCTCKGANRVYQHSDGKCICKSGYAYYSGVEDVSNQDSSHSCVPIVYDRCVRGQVRSFTGYCVSEGSDVCQDACDENGGVMTSDTKGICECNNIRPVQEVCDSTCRASRLKLQIRNGQFVVYDPITDTILETFSSTTVSGTISCTDVCNVEITKMQGTGFLGLYLTNLDYYRTIFQNRTSSSGGLSRYFNTFEDSLIVVPPSPSWNLASGKIKRGINDVQEIDGIVEPIVCLTLGSGMVWDVSSSKSNYPIYVKDSTFNSNPDFDSGPFRNLQLLMQSNVTISLFVYMFQQAGTYVFSNAGNPSKITIIKVTELGVSCPDDQTFKPLLATNLAGLSVVISESPYLSPDFVLIIVLCVGFILFLTLLLLGIHFFRTRTWSSQFGARPRFRKNLLSNQESNSPRDGEEKLIHLERLNVRLFMEKLRKNQIGVDDYMDNYKDDLDEKYASILRETTLIKEMLGNHVAGTTIVNVEEKISTLKTVNEVDDIHPLISDIQTQLENFYNEKNSKKNPDVAHLDTEVAQKVLELDDKDDKDRTQIIETFQNLIEELKNIYDSIGKVSRQAKKNGDKNNSKFEEHINSLKDQFNQTISDAKENIEKKLSELNETIKLKNNLITSGSHEFTLNTDSAEKLRNFLQETLKDLFMSYRQKQEEKERKSSEEVKENEEDKEEEEEDESPPEEPAENASEIQLIEYRYLKQRHEMKTLQKGEIEQLEEDIDKEFLKEKESIEKIINEETNAQIKQMKQDLRTKLDSGALNEEEQKVLIKDSKKRMDTLKNAMDREKENQTEMLTRLLEQKKAQKLKALKDRHMKDRKAQKEALEKEKQEVENLIKKVDAESSKIQDESKKEIYSQTELLKGKLEARKQQKAKAHLIEKMNLDEYIDNIEKIDREIIKRKDTTMNEANIQNYTNVQKQLVESLQGKISKEELDEIVQKQKEDLNNYISKLEDASKKEQEKAEDEYNTRRTTLIQQNENRRALAEQAEIKAEEKDLEKVRKLIEGNFIDADSINASKAAARRRQEVEMQKKLLELSLRREEKKRLFDEQKEKEIQKIENEQKELIDSVTKKIEEDISKKLSQKEQFLKQQLEQNDLSSSERDKIILAHKMDVEEYKQKMDENKKKQLDEINKKMAQRLQKIKNTLEKRTKEDELNDLKQQEKLLDQNLKHQFQELPKMHIELSKKAKEDVESIKNKHVNIIENMKDHFDAELKELDKSIIENEKQSSDSEKIKKKHEKAKQVLESQLQADLAATKDSEHERIMKRYSSDMEKLEKLHENQLKSQEDSLQQKLAKKRAELIKKQQEKLNSVRQQQTKEEEKIVIDQRKEAEKKKILDMIMDEKHKISSIEDAVNSVIYERHQKELNTLEMKQKFELKSAKPESEIDSVKAKHLEERVKLKKLQLEEKNQFVDDFSKYKDLIKHENQDQHKLQEEMELLHENIMKQKEANIARIERQKQALREQMQKELEEESKKVKEEEEKMRKRLEKAKNELQVDELVQEVEKQQQELLSKQKDLEKDEKSRLLDQHQLNLSAFEDALNAERIRQEDILRKRIDEAEALDRKRRLDEALEKMNAQFTGKRIKKDKEETATPAPSLITNIASNRFNDTISKFKKIKAAEEYFPKEGSWVGPLYQRIKNIESQVLSEKRAYIDTEDPEQNEGALTIITDGTLTLTQLIVCRFGHFILFTLQQKYRTMKRVKLLIAKTLPKTSYVRNAFKNSFYFDENSNTLFIRHTRLATVGKFVLTLVHCLAHIHAGNLFDDTHPEFLKYFYAFLTGVNEEIFTTNQIKKYESSPDDAHHKTQVVKELIRLEQTTNETDAFLAKLKQFNPAIENAPQKIASEMEYLKFELGRLVQEKKNVSNAIEKTTVEIKNLNIEIESEKKKGSNTTALENKLKELQAKSQHQTNHLMNLSDDIRKIESRVSLG